MMPYDAEAIVITAQRPEMRFVDPKSEEQQSSKAGRFYFADENGWFIVTLR
jgi:hypothetical protein